MTTHLASPPFPEFDDLSELYTLAPSQPKYSHGAGAFYNIPIASPVATISTEQFNELSKPRISFGQTA